MTRSDASQQGVDRILPTVGTTQLPITPLHLLTIALYSETSVPGPTSVMPT